MNEGLTADLYQQAPNMSKRVPEREPIDKLFVSLVAIMSAIGGFTAYNIMSMEVEPAAIGIQTVGITKFIMLDSALGRHVAQSPGVGADIGQTWCAYYNNTGTRVFVLRATIFAFDYINFQPPSNFIDARLTLPLTWFTSSNITGPWGKDVGGWIERNFSVSLYEIRQSWFTDGVSWNDIKSNIPSMDRNPVDTIWGINKATYGYGSLTHGNISFNIYRAIQDWKDGLWTPARGFLVAMIAPWETTDQPWFSYTGLLYLGIGLNFDTQNTILQIGITNPIPEFSTIIPMIGVMAVIILLRRKPYIIAKT